jgi:hypothetical protein
MLGLLAPTELSLGVLVGETPEPQGDGNRLRELALIEVFGHPLARSPWKRRTDVG